MLIVNGTENNSDTKQEKPGPGGAITAVREGFNELEEVTEVGCVLKEMSGGRRSIPKNQTKSILLSFILAVFPSFHLLCFLSKARKGQEFRRVWFRSVLLIKQFGFP